MLRSTILLLSVLLTIGLAWVIGFWILLVLFAAAMATVLFSTGDASDAELAHTEMDTGYRSTMAAGL